MTIVQIIPEQWDAFLAHFSAVASKLESLEAYIQNQFVLMLWGTLAICFIMAIAFYLLFTGRSRK
jgi:hypothetical protein